MTMQRRRWTGRALAASLAVATIATASGCSNGGGGGGEGDGTLNVLIAAPQAGAGEILETQFEEQTGAEVEVTVVPYDQIQTTAILDVQSGSGTYDAIVYWYTGVGALAEAGALMDLTDWIESDDDIDADDFLPTIYDAYSLYDGQRYGLPVDGDTHVLFYNTDILERNGVQPPTTWDEYLTAAQTITENESGNGVYGSALLGDSAAFNIGSTFFNRLATISPDPIDSQRPDLSSEYALQAAQAMLDASEYALPSPLEIGFEEALPQFLAGNVGMMEFWTDLGVFAQDPEQSSIVDGWGVVPLPVGPEGRISGAMNAGWAIGISPATDDLELAQDFVAFATSSAMNVELSSTTGSGVDPTRTSTLTDATYTDFAPAVSEVAAQVLPEAQPWPTGPNAPDMISTLSDNLALMLQGNLTPEQALSQTSEAWDQLEG
ncbi:ABC transporter substrate-binding protein [Agrococcus sp. SGAir0287]|uniref:ABC transporter substrate-binding protein n=1 Tax=Agrococcus sp. SGAir0287 TaxID=2070347 RepID=UPI0010CD2FAF|nr:sugar ABC transporter substrate-binding protein [Agrococcus sp. SGAir0287]QCR20252.1 ABC transporter substrate-binding protein [Agrococcus sp. SGAir0287]